MESEKPATRSATPKDEGKQVASFAHEINNPLQALLNLLCLVEADANLPEPDRRYLSLAGQEAHRISRITQAAMNKPWEADCPQKTNVPRLLRSVLEFYRSRFESRGISVDARFCPDGDSRVYSVPLRQTFSNLLMNAADAMPKGGKMHARVSLAREWAGRKRRGLRVTIADNGCGVSQDNLPRITDPFFTTKGSKGTGIGLSLVKQAVQKHDGVLRVRSSTKAGRSGTVFAIFLPAT